jgi:succinate dehydrogenase/fumarate reductase flavoprotein subunit
MAIETHQPDHASKKLSVDVLVLGGGPAGTWAALAAARQGARVVLADKGYCGTSGATAPSNTGAWYLPQGAQRAAEADRRFARAGGIAHRRWMLRVMEQACKGLDELGAEGYPFPLDEDGSLYRANLRGPDYMRYMRKRVKSAGVQVLDYHPALELLWADGAVAGAAGTNLRTGERWQINAGAVVLATGGCAFLSRALGTDGNTGDGYLMGAEAGARLSGMEFSAQYGLSASHSSVTKGLTFAFASFYMEDGSPLPQSTEDRSARIARALIEGRQVYALMDRGTPEEHDWLRRGQPNCFLAFDRAGIDPFKQRFPVTLRSEGTVRGVGGLDVITDDCATTVPGLYAAGDAATRENIVGAVSGGGSPNASWAISSGTWSGTAAAQFAKGLGAKIDTRGVVSLGGAGLRPRKHASDSVAAVDVAKAVQEESLPLDVNFFRRADRIVQSRERLDAVWNDVRDHLAAPFNLNQQDGRALLRAREAAALTATARWVWAAADNRTESRGLHRRTDFTETDRAQTHRIHLSGLDRIDVSTDESDWKAVAS